LHKILINMIDKDAGTITLDGHFIHGCQAVSFMTRAGDRNTVTIELVPSFVRAETVVDDLYFIVGEKRYKVVEEDL
jgi:hypothetical protein